MPTSPRYATTSANTPRKSFPKHSRELRQLLQRSRATSLQKFGNYSRVVLQADEWQIFAPAVHLAKWTRGVETPTLLHAEQAHLWVGCMLSERLQQEVKHTDSS